MPKKLLGYFASIAAALLIAFAVRYCLSSPSLIQPSAETNSLSTQALFAAKFSDVGGNPQAISQWKGKIIVVNFWATWCPPCREEMPELSRLQEQYRNRGLVVLGISTDELDKIREFVKENPVSYPLLSGEIDAMNVGLSLGNDKGVLPYTVIIKPDGNIAKTYFGRVNQAQLKETLLPLMSASK
jgi:peroxiredoxin